MSPTQSTSSVVHMLSTFKRLNFAKTLLNIFLGGCSLYSHLSSQQLFDTQNVKVIALCKYVFILSMQITEVKKYY